MNKPEVRVYEQLSTSKKRGCPCCDGVHPKSCMRCKGKTKMCDWYYKLLGWTHDPFLQQGKTK